MYIITINTKYNSYNNRVLSLVQVEDFVDDVVIAPPQMHASSSPGFPLQRPNLSESLDGTGHHQTHSAG